MNLHLHTDFDAVSESEWDALLLQQDQPTPFMRWRSLAALQHSATPERGWTLCLFTLRDGDALLAACAAYLKAHSWGEFVFDQAWARAYGQHGLDYYPKLVIAVPFTPVPGSRLLARDAASRTLLLGAIEEWARAQQLSGVHLLFGSPADAAALSAWSRREQPQFHWQRQPEWRSFEDFLASLRADKRKKIRQERRRVREAGVEVSFHSGETLSEADWQWVYRCYAHTYAERGQPPYLQPQHFALTRSDWQIAIAQIDGERIAAALLVEADGVLYGRHWGALRTVDCLHFELCYYAPLEWAIARGLQRFEGGAQGAHKLARGFLPETTFSLHRLFDTRFAAALDEFSSEERSAVSEYEDELRDHAPFKRQAG